MKGKGFKLLSYYLISSQFPLIDFSNDKRNKKTSDLRKCRSKQKLDKNGGQNEMEKNLSKGNMWQHSFE